MIFIKLSSIICLFFFAAKPVKAVEEGSKTNTHVEMHDDLKWKYWPLIEKINNLVYKQQIEAFSNLINGKKVMPENIDSNIMIREVISVPDSHFPNEFKDSLITNTIPLEDWFDGFVFTIQWEKWDSTKCNGTVIGFGLSCKIIINNEQYGNFPAYFIKIASLSAFTPLEQKQLKEILLLNCTSYTSETKLFTKERSHIQNADSNLDFSVFKTESFYNANKLFFDAELNHQINSYSSFSNNLHVVDTLGINRDSRYFWRYPSWLFLDHLVYKTHVFYNPTDWNITIYWQSIGLAGQDKNGNTKSFYMSIYTFQHTVSVLNWKNVLSDYKYAAIRGFERPANEY